ncbi:MAG: antitoxin Xre/MbcA/ParS toxin-binding domain-containing protein [Desulfobacterales bacterium]
MAARIAPQKGSDVCMPVTFESFLVWTPSGFRQAEAFPGLPGEVSDSEYFHIPVVRRAKNSEELIATLKQGLPVSNFWGLAKAMGITIDDLCEVTGIALRTLRRRKQDGRLTPQESERVYRVANVFNGAVTVFGDAVSASSWMREPLVALSGRTPLDYCGTEIGAREVEDILGRILHGDFS